MSERPPRRWFHFSLRGMFIALTVLCCWLAWQTSVVRERRAVLAELRGDRTYYIVTAADWKATFRDNYPIKPKRVSIVRRWLGDEAIQEVWYSWYQGPSEQQIARLRRVFPEAKFSETLPPPSYPG